MPLRAVPAPLSTYDQVSDSLGHLHRLVRVLDDNEFDELASGGWAPGAHCEEQNDQEGGYGRRRR